jgi:hypothetical protein
MVTAFDWGWFDAIRFLAPVIALFVLAAVGAGVLVRAAAARLR